MKMKIADFQPGTIFFDRSDEADDEVRERFFIRVTGDDAVQARYGKQYVAAHYLGFIQGVPPTVLSERIQSGVLLDADFNPRVNRLLQVPCRDPGCTDGRYLGFPLSEPETDFPVTVFIDTFLDYYGYADGLFALQNDWRKG